MNIGAKSNSKKNGSQNKYPKMWTGQAEGQTGFIRTERRVQCTEFFFFSLSVSFCFILFIFLSFCHRAKKGSHRFSNELITIAHTHTHTIFTVTSFDLFVHFVLCPLKSLCDSLNRSLFVEIWLLNWIVNSMTTTTKTKAKRQKSHNLWCAIEIREKWAHKYKQPSLSSEIVNAKAKTDFFSSSLLNGNSKNIMAES